MTDRARRGGERRGRDSPERREGTSGPGPWGLLHLEDGVGANPIRPGSPRLQRPSDRPDEAASVVGQPPRPQRRRAVALKVPLVGRALPVAAVEEAQEAIPGRGREGECQPRGRGRREGRELLANAGGSGEEDGPEATGSAAHRRRREPEVRPSPAGTSNETRDRGAWPPPRGFIRSGG